MFDIDIARLDRIEDEVAEIIENSAKEAINAPFPDASELETDVIL